MLLCSLSSSFTEREMAKSPTMIVDLFILSSWFCQFLLHVICNSVVRYVTSELCPDELSTLSYKVLLIFSVVFSSTLAVSYTYYLRCVSLLSCHFLSCGRSFDFGDGCIKISQADCWLVSFFFPLWNRFCCTYFKVK